MFSNLKSTMSNNQQINYPTKLINVTPLIGGGWLLVGQSERKFGHIMSIKTFPCVCLRTCWWDWWRWRKWAGSRKGHSLIWTQCPPGPWGWDSRTGHWPGWCWLPSLLATLSQTHHFLLLFHGAYAKSWGRGNTLIFGAITTKSVTICLRKTCS